MSVSKFKLVWSLFSAFIMLLSAVLGAEQPIILLQIALWYVPFSLIDRISTPMSNNKLQGGFRNER